jgi:lipid-A-disaccharide synthase
MKPPVDSVMFNMRPNPGIMIVAGEASGDMHGAKLAEALARQDRRPDVFGIGGDRMRSAGVRIEVDAHRLSVVGITEVLAKLPQILDGMRTAKRLIREKKPDLLILIDFPDFNLHLASFAKRHAVPVLYYISPQIWAWRQGRVRKIRRIVDHMAVILPFEETFYRRHGVPVTFVGHPIMDHYVSAADPSVPPRDDQTATVGLLPGSRDSEVRKLLPLMLSAAERIGRRRNVHFLLSQAPSVSPDLIRRLTQDVHLPITLFRGDTGRLLRQASLVIVASGTSTLEAAIHGTPMIIVYKVSPLSYRLGKALIRVPHIGLVNLIAGKRVAPEFIQDEASPDQVAAQVLALLEDAEHMGEMKYELAEVTRRLGSPGASDKVAKIAWKLLAAGRPSTSGTAPEKEDHVA